jgi:hypothetical protein
MVTFEDPAADAEEAQTALRALAHATRSMDDPRQVYSVLGSLSSAAASLGQSLHQLGATHDGAVKARTWVVSGSGRAAAYQVSWELHRAGEILHQVAESLARAHNAESHITYEHSDLPATRALPAFAETPRGCADHGIGL